MERKRSFPELDTVKIVRSRRRTVSVEVKSDLTLFVRAPMRMSDREILNFLERQSDWIANHLAKMEQRAEYLRQHPVERFTREELQALAGQAREAIPERASYFAAKIGVTYGRITIRSQRTRWGSCSAKGNLNFNCLLMLAPPEVLDYVVVHELCHRREMNHSARFWALVREQLPDYRTSRRWLKENGAELLRRLE